MNLLEYIEKNNVSRSAFAMECKMSVSMLSRILNGSRSPSRQLMFRILKATKGKVKIDVFNR